jgi:hypothetical protein
MKPQGPSYVLTPSWEAKGRRLLVRAVDAISLCSQGGYEKVPRDDTEACLLNASRRDRAYLCAFVRHSGVSHASLSSLDDFGLLDLLRAALRRGEIVVVRQSHAVSETEDSPSQARQRLVVAIRKASGQSLIYQGRKYLLIADGDLAQVPSRDSYEVVGRKDAFAVLEGIARTANPDLAGLLAQACESLTQDWRPPFSPNGLILLRARIRRTFIAQPADEKGWRPSAPKKSVFNPSGSPEPQQPEVDPVRQAMALIGAARAGVPFCEECTD